MPRKQGLTSAQIEELLNISPTQSEVEVSDLDSSGESGDDDYVPPAGSDSSDSDAVCEGAEGAIEKDGAREVEEFIEEEEIEDQSEEPPAKRECYHYYNGKIYSNCLDNYTRPQK